MELKCKTGDTIWVVERDEEGIACEVSGILFLASVANAIICTPRINGCENIEKILAYHIRDTQRDYNANIPIYPAKDCYLTKSEAENALAEEDI